MNIQENKRYFSAGFIIDIDQHTIESKDGELVTVRPRTFTLLKLLLMQSKQIVSKEMLLESIWDDVLVDEQVLFQSISEIRQLFKNPTVIKTYPRKGYIWTVDVEEFNDNFFLKFKKPILITLALSLVIGLVFIYWHSANKPSNEQVQADVENNNEVSTAQADTLAVQGSVLILPFKSTILSPDHKWVSLGAMDQLIALLRPENLVVIRDTEVVLDLMQQASLSRTYTSEQVHKLFDITQAAVVVESTISGNINEYRLVYKIHHNTHLSQGLIESTRINLALIELAERLSQQLNIDTNKANLDYQSDYRSALMVNALEEFERKNHSEAATLLNELIRIEPSNITARRKLAESQFYLGQHQQALRTLDKTVTFIENTELPNNKNSSNLARIHYWQAFIEYKQSNYLAALERLEEAEKKLNQDWLYAAYVAELKGTLLIRTQKQQEGIHSYRTALRNYGGEHCPTGRGRTYLHLANAYYNSGEHEQAQKELKHAELLMQSYKLSRLQSYFDNSQALIANNNKGDVE